jgi:hypothetical protein
LFDNWIASDTAQIGDTYAGGVFSSPEPDADAQWRVVRAERNKLLAQCDWTQLPDAPADAAVWAVYRQALRDITTQADPFNIVWPTAPKGL